MLASSVVVAACASLGCGSAFEGTGGNGPGTTSAVTTANGTGDAGSNGATSTATGAPVLETVRALDTSATTPMAGIAIIVYDADGHVVAQAVTAANGEAQVDVPDKGGLAALASVTSTVGGTVSIARDVVTVDAIPDGGLVTLPYFTVTPEAPPTPHDPVEYLTIHLANHPAGTASVVARPSCGTPVTAIGTAATISGQSNYRGCPDRSDFEVFAVAFNDAGQVIGSGKSPTVTLAADLPANASVDFPLSNVQAYESGIDGVPTDATNAIGKLTAADQVGNLVELSKTQFAPSNPFEWAPGAPSNGDFSAWTMRAEVQVGDSLGTYRLASSSIAVSPFRLDVDSIQRQDEPGEDVSDASHLLITFDVEPGSAGSAATSFETWTHGSESTKWTAITSPGGGKVRFPDLPAELDAWALHSGDLLDGALVTQTLDAAAPTYAAWLAEPKRGADVTVSWGKNIRR